MIYQTNAANQTKLLQKIFRSWRVLIFFKAAREHWTILCKFKHQITLPILAMQ